jgi:hypothetical protein
MKAESQTQDAADAFIARWQGVSASELSTSQSFLIDLCRLLGVDVPHATAEQDYMFERPITFLHGDGSTSAGRIDLYRRGGFVLESKKLRQGAHTKGFDDALLRARSQAEAYARSRTRAATGSHSGTYAAPRSASASGGSGWIRCRLTPVGNRPGSPATSPTAWPSLRAAWSKAAIRRRPSPSS